MTASSSLAGRSRLTAVGACLPGLLLAAALALAANALAAQPWLRAHGIGVLTVAIVLGMLVGNTAYAALAARCDPGVGFARQTLLRLGIVLYGLRLSFQDLGQLGVAGLAIDAAVLASTFALAALAGPRLFGLDRGTSMLIGAGGAICGAAAVMAAAPVLRARPAQVAVAVATVVLFGTAAMFLYPVLYRAAGGALDVSPAAYGLYVGSTVHEVAQVVAASEMAGPQAADLAVIAKMARVMMLAPFLLLLSAAMARGGAGHGARITVPWFAFGFIAVAALHPLLDLPPRVLALMLELDTLLLALAMAALGLGTRLSAVREAGLRPLALAALLALWLLLGGFAINRGLSAWLG